MQRLLGRIASLPSAGDALIHLQSIVASENFRPSYLGTLSLIVQRGGSNVTSALSEFDRLISLPKFNQHVARTARLAIVRAGENSHEALRGLYFLVSNPSFTPNSLTIALPDRFLSFLDQAIRSGGDAPYMAIRAMGSMFANSQFTPSDLTVREAREFATVLRQVQTWSRVNHLTGMDALCSLLANSAIRPQDLTAASARELGTLVNIVVEYARVKGAWFFAREGGEEESTDSNPIPRRDLAYRDLLGFPSTIEGSTRTLNLILGHRTFTIEMLSESGLLNLAINSSSESISAVLPAVYRVMRASRRRPEVMALATHLIGQREDINLDPLAILHLVDSLASNPRLAPLLSQSDFRERLTTMLTTLGESQQMIGGTQRVRAASIIHLQPFLEHPYLIPLMEMVERGNFTPAAFGMLEGMVSELGRTRGDEAVGSVDVGIFLMNAALSRPRTRPSQELFRDITALARQLREKPAFDYTGIGTLLSSRFLRPEMLRSPGGLLPYLIRVASTSQISDSARNMAEIMRRLGNGSQVISMMRDIVRLSGRDTSFALVSLNYIAKSPHFTRRNYAALLSLINQTGRLSHLALNLYHDLLSNSSMRPSLSSTEYVARIGRLIVRSRGTSPGDARMAVSSLGSIMSNPRFRPEMIERLEYISRVAGPNARHVFSYVSTMIENESLLLEPVLSDRFVQYLTGIAVLYSTYGGRYEPALHVQFAEYLEDLGIQALEGPRNFSQIRSSFEALMRSAGPEAGSDALRCYALSIRHYVLGQEDSIAMGRFIRRELSGLEGQARDDMITNLSGMFSTARINVLRIVIDSPELYRRGRALARRLIRGVDDPNIFLNFAYAIDEVGVGATTAIYRRYGIRHFARFSDDMLEQLNETITEGVTKPTILVFHPASDYNGAFYVGGRRLDELLDDYNVIIYERSDEEGFYGAISDFGERFGTTSTMIIAGHGQPSSITLGEQTETGQLDLTDEAELAQISTVLGPSPTVILESCSTGAGPDSIGAMMSRVLGARLYAPTKPGYLADFHIRRGRVSASYSVLRAEYAAGTPTSGG